MKKVTMLSLNTIYKPPPVLLLAHRYSIGASGFITADVEMINYSGAKYSSDISGITFNSDNETINELYQPTVNYRIGGEYRYNNFRFRAGYAYMPDPFKSEQNGISRKMNSFSTGVGYRNKKFYSDLAVRLHTRKKFLSALYYKFR
ncbi:MAG: hypothetical protein U5K54_20975 [Cytophagales bacterium]|nr:hypothetical protein [Cytophagales bacterium]